MTAGRVSAFTSEKAEARFRVAYQRIFARLWPTDTVAVDLPTAYGTTRAYRLGGDGVPFVLLPGSAGNSLMWHTQLNRLRRDRPVIAIDPVGEPGGSVQTAPIENGADWARWLDEVLAGLGVGQAHLVGCSYGGWVALQHELHSPGRMASITLLDPGGFGRITRRFLAWIIAGGLAALTPGPIRSFAARPLRNAALRDDEVTGLMKATFGFRRRLPLPPELTDEELRRVTVPVLVLLGERSQMYDASAVAKRIGEVMPMGVAEVVPVAGHDLPVHSPDLVAERTAEFAARAEAHA